MSSTSLNILVATGERPLLRQLAGFLELFGYSVAEAADVEIATAAVEAQRPDVLIVDWDLPGSGGLDFCRTFRAQNTSGETTCMLLMKSQPTVQGLVQALEAGCDDFLAKPIVYGELLARLRAAARLLDADRHTSGELGTDPVSNLPNAGAFAERLERRLATASAGDRPLSCIVLGVDYFNAVNRRHGWAAGNVVLSAVARQLTSSFGSADMVARLDGDRFGISLPEVPDARAAAWSERFRVALAELEIPWSETTLRVTASFGIAAARPDVHSAEQLIARAAAAMRAAKRSGRNGVIIDGELDDEILAWREQAAPSRLFDRTTARDVMTPCGLILREDDPLAEAAVLLSKSCLGVVPVVNREGNLSGLLSVDSLPEDGKAGTSELVRSVMTSDVVNYEEATSFDTLFEYFVENPRSEIVVVDKGRPRGMVSRAGLAALIDLPLEEEPADGSGQSKPAAEREAAAASG